MKPISLEICSLHEEVDTFSQVAGNTAQIVMVRFEQLFRGRRAWRV